MQSHQSHIFSNLGRINFTKHEVINSPRGHITDALGNFLATSKPIYTIYWQGTGNKNLTKSQEAILDKLNKLNIIVNNLSDLIKAEKHNKIYLLADNIPFDLISQISEQFIGEKNIYIKKDWVRYYPYGSRASHIIGYLGKLQGKMGLEFFCDNDLKGSSGSLVKIINSFGTQMQSYEEKKALIGQTINTTLNINIQKIAEDLFPENYAGACILFNPYNGDLEAVVSKPDFNPEIFLKPLDYKTWESLQSKNCFINRAFNACYPPASIFKLVTLSAALENNIISLDHTWNCKGHMKFGNRLYHCQRRRGHGLINLTQGIAYSCNIPFYDIAKSLSIDSLAEYAKKLGLGLKTDFLLSEKAGLIPTSSWKMANKKERWYTGETLSAAIGQSFILVTPVQICKMLGAFCTGYLTSPRILLNQSINREKVSLQTSTILSIRQSMRASTKIGSAKNLNRLKNFKIWSKTGTAQTRRLSKNDNGNCHAWLGTFFRYKNQDPRVLVIFIEHAGGSRVATQYAEKFFDAYAKYYSSV